MKKLEELIYSIKYLPQTLYFGSVGLLGYDIYYYVVNEMDFLNSYIRIAIGFVFILMTGFALKDKKKKKWKNYSTITMKESKTSLGAGIGLLAGIIIGSATDNVGLWVALGLCFGAGIGTTLEKKTKWKS